MERAPFDPKKASKDEKLQKGKAYIPDDSMRQRDVSPPPPSQGQNQVYTDQSRTTAYQYGGSEGYDYSDDFDYVKATEQKQRTTKKQ